MVCKETLNHLFDGLNEHDQKKAYEFIKSLSHPYREKAAGEEVIQLFGKNYYVVPD
jgi:hypothetical protein